MANCNTALGPGSILAPGSLSSVANTFLQLPCCFLTCLFGVSCELPENCKINILDVTSNFVKAFVGSFVCDKGYVVCIDEGFLDIAKCIDGPSLPSLPSLPL